METNETPDTLPTTIPADLGTTYDTQADAIHDAAPTIDDIDAARWNPDDNARPVETTAPDPDPIDPFTDQTIGTDDYNPLSIPGPIIAKIIRSWEGSAFRWQTLDPHRTKPASREEACDDAAALYLWAAERGADWYRARGLRTGDHAGFRALIRGCARRMHWRIPQRADSRAGRPRTAADRVPMPWKHGSPAANPAAVAALAENAYGTTAAVALALNGTGMAPERPIVVDGKHSTTHYPSQRGTYRRPARMEWIETGSRVEGGEELVTLELRMVERWSGSPIEWPGGSVVNVTQAVTKADAEAVILLEVSQSVGPTRTRGRIRNGR